MKKEPLPTCEHRAGEGDGAGSGERPGVWGGGPCCPRLSAFQVYSIISIQLLITVATIAIFTFV